MYGSQLPFVELFRSLHDYAGADAYGDVLGPWLDGHAEECWWIADWEQQTNDNWELATDEDLCRLYAIFRVTSTLLLRFQPGRADGSDYRGPAVTVEDFRRFHQRLGFRATDVAEFHPFYHEIVAVEPAVDDDAPIRLVECRWPGLMLGDMVFCRAGCAVAGGASHVVREIAESSTLYWTYRRKDRPHDDQSHGWGSNSQWRTAHRRDYRSDGRYYYNVDGKRSLNDPDCEVEDLSVEAMIEVVRNRCQIRTLAGECDLFPYHYTYSEDM